MAKMDTYRNKCYSDEPKDVTLEVYPELVFKSCPAWFELRGVKKFICIDSMQCCPIRDHLSLKSIKWIHHARWIPYLKRHLYKLLKRLLFQKWADLGGLFESSFAERTLRPHEELIFQRIQDWQASWKFCDLTGIDNNFRSKYFESIDNLDNLYYP